MGTLAWFDWLEQQSAFLFIDRKGRFTAYKRGTDPDGQSWEAAGKLLAPAMAHVLVSPWGDHTRLPWNDYKLLHSRLLSHMARLSQPRQLLPLSSTVFAKLQRPNPSCIPNSTDRAAAAM